MSCEDIKKIIQSAIYGEERNTKVLYPVQPNNLIDQEAMERLAADTALQADIQQLQDSLNIEASDRTLQDSAINYSITAITTSVNDIRQDISDLQNGSSSGNAALDSLRQDIQDLQSEGTTLTNSVNSIEQELATLQTASSSVASDISDIEDALPLKEDKANKVTSLSSSSTDTEYPTAKAVYDSLASINGGVGSSISQIEQYVDEAQQHAADAEQCKTDACACATNAQTSADEAAQSALDATTAEANAELAESNAEAAQAAAEQAATDAHADALVVQSALNGVRARGVVINALTSQGSGYGLDSLTIDDGGTGYTAGDAIIVTSGDAKLDAVIVVTSVAAGGVIDGVTVTKKGVFKVDSPIVSISGGTGADFTFYGTYVEEPYITLADIQNPIQNDSAYVLEDELHPDTRGNGQPWMWIYADYNGDGISNWVPQVSLGSIVATATQTTEGIVRPDNTTVNITDGVLSVPIATATTPGLAKAAKFTNTSPTIYSLYSGSDGVAVGISANNQLYVPAATTSSPGVISIESNSGFNVTDAGKLSGVLGYNTTSTSAKSLVILNARNESQPLTLTAGYLDILKASDTQVGVVKVDGTTITAGADGTISTALGSTISVPLATATQIGGFKLPAISPIFVAGDDAAISCDATSGLETKVANGFGAIAAKPASSLQRGTVKVDGTTITATAEGVISAVNTGSSTPIANGTNVGTIQGGSSSTPLRVEPANGVVTLRYAKSDTSSTADRVGVVCTDAASATNPLYISEGKMYCQKATYAKLGVVKPNTMEIGIDNNGIISLANRTAVAVSSEESLIGAIQSLNKQAFTNGAPAEIMLINDNLEFSIGFQNTLKLDAGLNVTFSTYSTNPIIIKDSFIYGGTISCHNELIIFDNVHFYNCNLELSNTIINTLTLYNCKATLRHPYDSNNDNLSGMIKAYDSSIEVGPNINLSSIRLENSSLRAVSNLVLEGTITGICLIDESDNQQGSASIVLRNNSSIGTNNLALSNGYVCLEGSTYGKWDGISKVFATEELAQAASVDNPGMICFYPDA